MYALFFFLFLPHTGFAYILFHLQLCALLSASDFFSVFISWIARFRNFEVDMQSTPFTYAVVSHFVSFKFGKQSAVARKSRQKRQTYYYYYYVAVAIVHAFFVFFFSFVAAVQVPYYYKIIWLRLIRSQKLHSSCDFRTYWSTFDCTSFVQHLKPNEQEIL